MKKIHCAVCNKLTNDDSLFCKWCGSIPDITKCQYDVLYHIQEIIIKIQKLENQLNDPSKKKLTPGLIFLISLEIKMIIANFTHAKGNSQKEAFENFTKEQFFDVPKSKMDATINHFSWHGQSSFLMEWLFLFEEHFYYILKYFLKKNPSSSYASNVITVIDSVISKEKKALKKKCIDSLYFPYVVRNTYHRNMVSDKNSHGKIDGFDFYIGKEQVCTVNTWIHLIFYVENMIDTLGLLFDQPFFADYKKKEFEIVLCRNRHEMMLWNVLQGPTELVDEVVDGIRFRKRKPFTFYTIPRPGTKPAHVCKICNEVRFVFDLK